MEILIINIKNGYAVCRLKTSGAMDDDMEWIPPTAAEMKVIQAKRERADKISNLMGSYLLKGYKMLNETCPKCTVSGHNLQHIYFAYS